VDTVTLVLPDDLIRAGVGIGIATALYFARRRGRLSIAERLFVIYCFIEISFYTLYYFTNRFTIYREYLLWLPSLRPFWMAWALVYYFKFKGKVNHI